MPQKQILRNKVRQQKIHILHIERIGVCLFEGERERERDFMSEAPEMENLVIKRIHDSSLIPCNPSASMIPI